MTSGWKQSGDGKHDKVKIDFGSGDSVRHGQSADTTYGGTKTVSESRSGGNELGHTTVHGNGHVNKHGSHDK